MCRSSVHLRLRRPRYLAALAIVSWPLWGSGLAVAQPSAASLADTTVFAQEVEALRQRYHIPSLSVGLVQQGKLVWYKGLGYADVEHQLRPTPHTVYHLASLTKTFGAIVLLQLVEAGKIKLDDPVTKYHIHLGARWENDPRIQLKHLLTHTAQGNTFNGFRPGYSFGYNGDYFAQLIKPIEQESNESFGSLLVRQVLRPLSLAYTAPNLADTVNFALTGYDRAAYGRLVAKPYDFRKGRLVAVSYPTYFGPSAGLMSCVSDLARYSHALDQQQLLSPATWQTVFTPFRSPKGKALPYGFGWFIQSYRGLSLRWHTGWWVGSSSLLVKVPDKDLTLIILANSQDVSRPFYAKHDFFRTNPRLQKDVRASAFANSFLVHFIRK